MTVAVAHRSRYIPWLFVGGLAITVAVNGVMVWFAVSSFSGLYTPRPRDIGLRYNDIIAEQKARDALGWRIEAAWDPPSKGLEVHVFDASGQPLSGARVAVELVRPVERMAPLDVAMAATDIGRFAGHIDLPERGNWDLDIVVERGKQRYALTRRMFLQ